ncbi:hypothetical protein [Sulfitobacter sp.]|uniref:hypothetical protein n=1 Tax=Sulfitobacter sp. TaxID=1903071 RepID=UPI0030014ED6
MTSIAHRYANFSTYGPDGEPAEPVSLEHIEDENLKAFEEGYQAGWSDADKNHTTEQKNIGEEFVHNLHDLSFTYQEALARLNRGLKPLFEHMLSALLPRTTSAALRAHVIEQLVQMAGKQTEAQITLRVSESSLPMIEGLLEDVELNLPVSLSADPTFSSHQLFVALETQEHEINLDAVCLEITTAMNAFNFHTQPECLDA